MFEQTWLEMLRNLTQIGILACGFYLVLMVLQGTAGYVILTTMVLLIPSLILASSLLKMAVLEWMLGNVIALLPLVILVIFQSEIRRLLIFLGGHPGRIFRRIRSEKRSQSTVEMIEALVNAVASFTTNREWHGILKGRKPTCNTGALIALESGTVKLREYSEKGIEIDAPVSSLLLQSIFYKGGPLHDGGVIIRANRIEAAACQFPVASTPGRKPVHTRHSAAVGLSEVTEAIVIVVSEESGLISVTLTPGMLERMHTPRQLRELLRERLGVEGQGDRAFWQSSRLGQYLGRLLDVSGD